MKIVHELNNEPQVGGTSRPWSGREGEVPRGFQVELVITAKPLVEGLANEAIHLHGDARHVRAALVQALEALDMHARAHVKRGELDPTWNDKAEP